MPFAFTIRPRTKSVGNRMAEATVRFVLSGNYATGGDLLDFTQAALAELQIDKNNPPEFLEFNCTTGYFLSWVPGTDASNGKMMARQCAGAGAPASELSAAAYPGALTADANLSFVVKYTKR